MSEISRLKKWFFNLLFLGIFICALAAVELGLRLFDYGIDTQPFLRPEYMPEAYIVNPRFVDKYFSEGPYYGEFHFTDILSVNKPARLLRGIIVGGSTAEGFPYYPNQAAAGITEAALKRISTDTTFKITNFGYSAMTSYYVKDAALKVLEYQPDFLIIYSGHNEFYGSISYSTGGNYYTKNLYMSLKEYKVGQLISDAINSLSPGRDRMLEGMSGEYNNTRFRRRSESDGRVASNFIRNIDRVVRAYARNNIPVIIIEPVSNLIDFPPFSGSNDSAFSDFIQDYYQSIKSNDTASIQSYYSRASSDTSYLQNANIVYLNAKAFEIITGEIDIDSYILAKDLDAVPFRARSALIRRLRRYYENNAEKYDNLIYVPTFDLLQEKYGPQIFGKQIFIEHLHFNRKGQRILASLLAETIADYYGYDSEQEEMMYSFLQNKSEITDAVHLSPLAEIWLIASLREALTDPPFSTMLLPYELPDYSAILEREEVLSTREFAEYLESVNSIDEETVFNYVINYYKSRNNAEKVHEYLLSYYTRVPGFYYASYQLADFYSRLANPPQDPLRFYLQAYLLSEKDAAMYNDMQAYLYRENRLDDLKQINIIYGSPID